MRTLALFALLAGCSGATPKTAEDCAGLAEGKARDECYLTVLVDVFKADPAAGVKMVESGITDPVNKDFAWYQVTKNVDPHSNKYCDRIEDDTLAARCRTIVARPHLHRDLTGKGGAGGPGGSGGPPGGSGGPPGGPGGAGGPPGGPGGAGGPPGGPGGAGGPPGGPGGAGGPPPGGAPAAPGADGAAPTGATGG